MAMHRVLHQNVVSSSELAHDFSEIHVYMWDMNDVSIILQIRRHRGRPRPLSKVVGTCLS